MEGGKVYRMQENRVTHLSPHEMLMANSRSQNERALWGAFLKHIGIRIETVYETTNCDT